MLGCRQAVVFALCVAVLVAAGTAMAVDKIWIAGTVTDSFELRTDDGHYMGIEPGSKGSELVFEHVGRRVIITGTVTEDDGYQRIAVESYEFIEE